MKTTAGYMLIEGLLTILLLAILLTLAAPAYNYLIADTQATTSINDLVAAINYARNEAIKRHQVVTLCKSADGQKCGGNWRDGWLIYTDDQRLRVYPALPVQDHLIWQSSLQHDDYLQLDALGGARQDGTFTYCSGANPSTINKVMVSFTGRVRVTTEKNDPENSVCLN